MTSQTGKYLQSLLLIPPIIAASLFGTRWFNQQNPVPAAKPIAQAAPVTEQSRREYVLEVIGLGVTLDKYRQGKLWEALQKGNPHASIREQDIRKIYMG